VSVALSIRALRWSVRSADAWRRWCATGCARKQKNGKLASTTPPVDLAALSTSLSSATGSAALSLPTDTAVLLRQQAEQVFLVLQYHFGTS